MAKRRVAIIACLICLWLTPLYTRAASTTQASEPINVGQSCTLTFSYTYGQTAFADVLVQLYRIASVSADFQYTLCPAFAPSDLVLNGIRTNGEWDVIRSTLEAHIVANEVETDAIKQTDAFGQAHFDALQPGLYLAIVGIAEQDDVTCFFDSALVALPALDADGRWQYQATVSPKPTFIPPVEADEEFHVIKLWKDDTGKNSRPKSIDVEIFQNGTSYQKVVLSQENNWSYSWSAKADGSQWTVVERNTPAGYTATVDKRDHSFVLTNTYKSGKPSGPSDTPQTGETSNVMWYVILMVLSGGLLIVMGKRNAHETSN